MHAHIHTYALTYTHHAQIQILCNNTIQNCVGEICSLKQCRRPQGYINTFKWSMLSLECCSDLHWSALSIRRQYLSMLMVYDILHGHIALKFSNYFSFTSTCTRAHSLSIQCKSSSINSYRYSFFVNSIFLWNKIHESILRLWNRNSLNISSIHSWPANFVIYFLVFCRIVCSSFSAFCFVLYHCFCLGCNPIGLSSCMSLSFD